MARSINPGDTVRLHESVPVHDVPATHVAYLDPTGRFRGTVLRKAETFACTDWWVIDWHGRGEFVTSADDLEVV